MAQARKGDRQIGGVLYLVTRRRRTDDDHRLPGHAKTWTGGKRKNENRRTNGRTLDKQGAIEINREYCEEYAQTRNSHSSSPSAHFSYSLLLFPTSIRSISFFLSLSPFIPTLRCPPFRFRLFERTCSLLLTFVARLASAFTSALLFSFVRAYPIQPGRLNLCLEMFR